ncbi:MAG: hypothetical protein PVG49_04255 [Desulfobacteraceae bacterium]
MKNRIIQAIMISAGVVLACTLLSGALAVDLKSGAVTTPSEDAKANSASKAPAKKTPTLQPAPSLKKEMKTPVPPASLIQTPEKGAPSMTPAPTPRLEIQRVYLKDNIIHVKIRNTGKGRLASSDYMKARLCIEPQKVKIPWSWPLLKVDPKRSSFKGEVDFDTGKAITGQTAIRAWLEHVPTSGEWKGTLGPQGRPGTFKPSGGADSKGRPLRLEAGQTKASSKAIMKPGDQSRLGRSLRRPGGEDLQKVGITPPVRSGASRMALKSGHSEAGIVTQVGIRVLSPNHTSTVFGLIHVRYEFTSPVVPPYIEIRLLNIERNRSERLYWGEPHEDGQAVLHSRYGSALGIHLNPTDGWQIRITGFVGSNRLIIGTSEVFTIGEDLSGNSGQLEEIRVGLTRPDREYIAGQSVTVAYQLVGGRPIDGVLIVHLYNSRGRAAEYMAIPVEEQILGWGQFSYPLPANLPMDREYTIQLIGKRDCIGIVSGYSEPFAVSQSRSGQSACQASVRNGVLVTDPTPGTRIFPGDRIRVRYVPEGDRPSGIRILLFQKHSGTVSGHVLYSGKADPQSDSFEQEVSLPGEDILVPADDWMILVETRNEDQTRWGTSGSLRCLGPRNIPGGGEGGHLLTDPAELGVRITSPSEGQVFYLGETLDVRYELTEDNDYVRHPRDGVVLHLQYKGRSGTGEIVTETLEVYDGPAPANGVIQNIALPSAGDPRFPCSTGHLANEAYQMVMRFYVGNTEAGTGDFTAYSEPFILAEREINNGILVTSPTAGQYIRPGHELDVRYRITCPDSPQTISIWLVEASSHPSEAGGLFSFRERLYLGSPHRGGRVRLSVEAIRRGISYATGSTQWRVFIRNDQEPEDLRCYGYSPSFRVGY